MNFLTTFWTQVQRRIYAAVATIGFLVGVGASNAQEAPTTVLVGARVTLSASADGSPAPTFQWRKNGTPVSGASDAILVIAAATLADAGKYTVVATNSAGSAVSPEAELLVQPAPPPAPNAAVAPVITAQPSNVVGVAGGSAVFSVNVTGTPAPSLQWYKNNAPVSGWTSATLTLPGLTSNDVATYKVVVTNEGGTVTSSDAQLSLQDPAAVASAPVISSQPVDVVGTVGGAAAFSVSATGSPAPSYQWYKNGTSINGATNSVLSLGGLSSSDAATYKVVVTNEAGTVTSSNAQLSLQDPVAVASAPAITNQPVDVVGTTGGAAAFSVSATGSPAPAFQWYKNGTSINAATSSVLSLGALSSSDVAAYKVVVTNTAGIVTSKSVTLSLQVPAVSGNVPVFTTQPSSQAANAGQNVTFSAVVSGSPQPTLQWRKNGSPIAGASSTTLSLTSITASDVGGYTLVAINAAGTTISSEAMLSMGSTPKFTKQPTPSVQTTPIGGSVRLSVTASGTPAPTYQWQKNGVSISGATDADLVLTNMALTDSALYTVVAMNPAGAAMSQKAEVVVGGAAPNVSAPIITAQPFSQTTVTKSAVTFGAAVSGSPAPVLQWRRNGIDIAGATASSYTISSVTLFDAGEYTIFARNDYGSTSSTAARLTVTSSAGNGSVSNVGGSVAPGDSGFDQNISRIVNLSVRASAGSGADSLIVGFVVSEGAQKPVLVRGIGPTLGLFGVAGALQDPIVSLYSGPVLASANDDWGSNNNVSEIRTRAAQLGAFALNETANDAALISILRSGTYTAQLTGQGTESGTALIEVYDGASKDGGRLINVSTRARVGTGGDVPNIGFVIEGVQPKKVLIRAVGPTLAAFGVGGVLTDPQLELFEGQSRILHNDNWDGSSVLTQAFSKVGAFSFSGPLSKDAALLVTLEPGAYTAVVSGVNGGTGTVLVEVYEVQ